MTNENSKNVVSVVSEFFDRYQVENSNEAKAHLLGEIYELLNAQDRVFLDVLNKNYSEAYNIIDCYRKGFELTQKLIKLDELNDENELNRINHLYTQINHGSVH